MRNWQNHHLADVDYSWDGVLFKEADKQLGMANQQRYAQQGSTWTHIGPLDEEKLKLSALEMNGAKA